MGAGSWRIGLWCRGERNRGAVGAREASDPRREPGTADRREALEAVIHDVAPDLTVFDDVKVVSVDAPAGREELR
ncbi:hypothetical protein K7G98_20385 [Saccharothrix sp. MB29]|nr:hypothetical protein [Saccharothrix sp. MB29]